MKRAFLFKTPYLHFRNAAAHQTKARFSRAFLSALK
jgi:hypothetical protein